MIFSWVTGKVKTILLGLALAVGPILYVFGLMKGKNEGKIDALQKDNARQKDMTDFYREMEGIDENDIRPRNRDELIERLRKTGF